MKTILTTLIFFTIAVSTFAENYICKSADTDSREQIKLNLFELSGRPSLRSFIWYNTMSSKRFFDTGEEAITNPIQPISSRSADEIVYQTRAENRKSSIVISMHASESDFVLGRKFKLSAAIKNKKSGNFECKAYKIK